MYKSKWKTIIDGTKSKKKQDGTFKTDIPSVAARVIAAKFSLEHTELGIGELVHGQLARADHLAEHINLAKADLADHVDKFAEFDLSVAIRIDFLDERSDLLWREVLTEVLERRGDLGLVDAVNGQNNRIQYIRW
jgi:hypothetical protein